VNVTAWDIRPPGEQSVYRIVSVASSPDTDPPSSTTIESYVSVTPRLPDFLGNAITSRLDVTIQPGSKVLGNVVAEGEVRGEECVTGTVTEGATIENWPEPEDLHNYYWPDVEGHPFTGVSPIDIMGGYREEGPWYTNGSLAIDNTKTGEAPTLKLMGTIYVKGNLEFRQPGRNKSYTIDLNGNTIYCEGDVTLASQEISVIGPGAIIAVGDLIFQPDLSGGDADHRIFLMSVAGTVKLQPKGSFFGSVAGDADVRLQPGSFLDGRGGGGGWHFPPIFGTEINTYNIYN